jgi:hypothetical protein
MTDNKKPQNFTTEEITSLKEIQIEMDQLIIGFGHLSINKESLILSENQLKQNLAQLKIKEKTLAQSLTDKYGKGTFDLETNEFTPVD